MDLWYGIADREYICAQYVRLDELAAQRGYSRAQVDDAIRIGELPHPPYVIDGDAWVPVGYFTLLEEAHRKQMTVKQLFLERYDQARRSVDLVTPDLTEHEAAWQDYLGGDYGVCLHEATPENIVLKSHLIAVIRELMRTPKLSEPEWQQQLRQSVLALDQLERPFAAGDRLRFAEASSRDLYVEAPQALFAEVFKRPCHT